MPSDLQDTPNKLFFSGIYYDGLTPSGQRILLNLHDDRLEIVFDDLPKTISWSYSEITHLGPLLSGTSSQIGHSKSESERVYVEDKIFSDYLLLKCPHLSSRKKNSKLFILTGLVAILSLIFIAFIWIVDISPSRIVAEIMPHQLRNKLGDTVLRQIINNRKKCEYEPGKDSFNKLTGRLIQNSKPLKNYDFRVAKLGVVNAFATPGTRIVVSDKLIEFVQSPEELAGVLAHEMGHGIAMHPETGIVRAMGFSLALQLLLGGSAGNIGDAGLLLLQLNYTRAAEREADQLALEILRKAGINARKFSDFFARIYSVYETENKQQDSDEDNLVDSALALLRTHPPTAERAEMFSNARTWPHYSILTNEEWVTLKKICS